MIPDKPIPGQSMEGEKSPVRIVGAIIDYLAVLEKITGAPPVMVDRGENGIVIRIDGPFASSTLTVARVSEVIARKGRGRAYALDWDDSLKAYTTPANKTHVDVYDVLQSYGLGPANVGADILMQLGNSGEWELVQVTCPNGA